MITLTITKCEQVQNVFLNTAKKSDSEYLIIVLFTKPSGTIRTLLNAENKDTVFFIDAVAPTNEKNAISVAPKDLTTLSIVISEALQISSGTKKSLLFDSIDAIMIHNKPQIVGKFLQFIIERSHTWSVDLTLIATQETNPEILNIVKQNADIVTETQEKQKRQGEEVPNTMKKEKNPKKKTVKKTEKKSKKKGRK